MEESNLYLKKVIQRKQRNKQKLQGLWLIPGIPTTPKTRNQKQRPKRVTQKKKSPKHDRTSVKRRFIVDKKPEYEEEETKSEDESCTNDHNNYQQNYKEEGDKLYFAENTELEGVNCRICKMNIKSEGNMTVCVPSIPKLAYICCGCMRYGCKQAVCFMCSP